MSRDETRKESDEITIYLFVKANSHPFAMLRAGNASHGNEFILDVLADNGMDKHWFEDASSRSHIDIVEGHSVTSDAR